MKSVHLTDYGHLEQKDQEFNGHKAGVEVVTRRKIRKLKVKQRGNRFGFYLNQARERQRMSGYDLAKAIGGHPSVVSNWVNGKSMPVQSNLPSIAKALDMDLAELTEVWEMAHKDKGLRRNKMKKVATYHKTYNINPAICPSSNRIILPMGEAVKLAKKFSVVDGQVVLEF